MSLVDPPLNMLKQGPSGLSKAPLLVPLHNRETETEM